MSPRLRKSLNAEDLREIAVVWEEANVVGGAPTATLAEEYGVSVATAGRWVRAARARGLVGAHKPGFEMQT